MKLTVDLSVLAAPSHAVGRVHGAVELSVVPRRGELMSFMFPASGTQPEPISGFSYQVSVDQVVYSPQSLNGEVTILLAPIELPSLAHARAVMQFFEVGFGLHAVSYDEDEA